MSLDWNDHAIHRHLAQAKWGQNAWKCGAVHSPSEPVEPAAGDGLKFRRASE
jgi:hypothetical protein